MYTWLWDVGNPSPGAVAESRVVDYTSICKAGLLWSKLFLTPRTMILKWENIPQECRRDWAFVPVGPVLTEVSVMSDSLGPHGL